jgi:hypothetical protein
MSTLNYAQQALGIKNKKQESSIKLVGSSMSSFSSSSASLSSTPSSGISAENWNDMECKLAYMENQVAEAQGMLGRKHEAMNEALRKMQVLEDTIDSHIEAKDEALAQLEDVEGDKAM